jgi:hypothetical protein
VDSQADERPACLSPDKGVGMMGPNPSMLRKSVLQAAVLCAASLSQPNASQAQNLAEDRKLFETTCTPCHNYDKGGEPDMYVLTLNLFGVVGRKAASVGGGRVFRRSAEVGHRLGRSNHRQVHHRAKETIPRHQDGIAWRGRCENANRHYSLFAQSRALVPGAGTFLSAPLLGRSAN